MNYVQVLSRWYHLTEDEETGGITCYMVCIEGTGDAKLSMPQPTPHGDFQLPKILLAQNCRITGIIKVTVLHQLSC